MLRNKPIPVTYSKDILIEEFDECVLKINHVKLDLHSNHSAREGRANRAPSAEVVEYMILLVFLTSVTKLAVQTRR